MTFGYIDEGGVRLIAAEAWIPDSSKHNGRRIGLLAISEADVAAARARGENPRLAQLEQILLPGLMLTRHIFQGLRRPLLHDGDTDGAAKKLIYSRKPAFNVAVVGDASSGFKSRQTLPPDAEVMCAIITPNDQERFKKLFPRVDGWIDRWSWVSEDMGLPEAPRNWIDRYDMKLLTIQDSDRISE